jgi:hypothetical protein
VSICSVVAEVDVFMLGAYWLTPLGSDNKQPGDFVRRAVTCSPATPIQIRR